MVLFSKLAKTGILMRLNAAVTSVAVLLLGVGVWIDFQATIDQTVLFYAFQAASLLGTGLAVYALWPKISTPALRYLMLFCALLVWRIAYFPILVISGWVATLGEWLLIQSAVFPVVIYPSFLLTMAGLYGVSIYLGGLCCYRRKLIGALPIVVGSSIAVLISFSTLEDASLLPDTHQDLYRGIPVESAVLPVEPLVKGNPYLSLTKTQVAQSSFPQHVLVYASGTLYGLIPNTPWSGTVKGILGQYFIDNPYASSSTRIQEHYLAFRAAQFQIHPK
mgnify:CR=1 FL=1